MTEAEMMFFCWGLVGVGCWMRDIIRTPDMFLRQPTIALLMLPIAAAAGATLLVLDE